MASRKSIARSQLPVRVKGDAKCKDHKNNDVVVLCQDCNALICVTCSITAHKSHIDSFIEMSKIKPRNQNIIRNFINETDNVKIPKLNQEIVSSRTKLSSCKPLYQTLRENIIDNNKECKLLSDKITKDYLSLCDEIEVTDTDLIQTHITNLEERLDTLRELSLEYKPTLQTGSAVLVYDSVSEIREMDSDIPPTPNIDITAFAPGQERYSHLKQAMGNMNIPISHLQERSANIGHSDQSPAETDSDIAPTSNIDLTAIVPGKDRQSLLRHAVANMNIPPCHPRAESVTCHSEKSPIIRPKQSKGNGQASTGADQYKFRDRPTVMSLFSYPDSITAMCPTYDGRAWLCDFNTNTVMLINNKGQVIQTIQHNSNIDNIGLDPTTGRLWFCCRDKRSICDVPTSSTPRHKVHYKGLPSQSVFDNGGSVYSGSGWYRGYTGVQGSDVHRRRPGVTYSHCGGVSTVHYTMWCYR
ncbi:uncharacterized protein LOC117318511 [Pecten maximus]|uniref:uncharacterized protein LOC117318511 n=1 Tax=Pecten maximus TaxID=6579 RepID=UPI001457ECA5|nr:uncharacterized protein LOC117318511 [Pecten maximus]